MMRIDQSGQDHMLRGIEGRNIGRRWRPARWHQLDDPAVAHHDAAPGIFRKNAEGVLDPDRARVRHRWPSMQVRHQPNWRWSCKTVTERPIALKVLVACRWT